MNPHQPAKTNQYVGNLTAIPELAAIVPMLNTFGIFTQNGGFTLEEVAAIFSIAASVKVLRSKDNLEEVVDSKVQDLFDRLKANEKANTVQSKEKSLDGV
jgi:hypothetical protein